MKKLLIKMAAGMFLGALSFMQANATCGLVPTITVQPGTHCAGDIITILGVNRASGSSSFVMELQTTDGTNYYPIASVTQTGRSVIFYHTVSTADGAVLAMKVKVYPAADCGGIPKFSSADYEYVDLTLTAWNVTVAGDVCSGPSYNFTLDGTDGSAANYLAYKNGIFLSSLVGDDLGNAPNFGPVSAVGAYTIVAQSATTGCKINQIGTLNIKQTPAVPTYAYTWCGAGNLLLQGITTTTLAGVGFAWIDQTTSATLSGQNITITSPPGHAYKSLTTLNGCSSALSASFTPAHNYLPIPIITSLVYDNDCPGPCGLGSTTITFPGTVQYSLHADAGSPVTNFFYLTSNVGGTGTTYQWYLFAGGGNVALTGVTGTTTPSYPKIANSDGTFTIQQTNVCGTVASNGVKVDFSAAGIGRKGLDDPADVSSGFLYPNPTSGELNINAPYDSYTLRVTNVLGVEVLSKEVSQKSSTVNLSSLTEGTYVVKLVSSEGTLTKQVQIVK